MKKFYAFAAAAMMALAANAQNGAPLYATGAGDFVGGSWAPATADEFTFADGVYTLEVANLTQFKVSTALGDESAADDEGRWAPFNAGALTCNYGSEPGVAVALEQGDANIVCPWKGDYTITVAGDLSTITLTTTTKKPEGGLAVYMRGGMNGWNAEDAWKLTEVGKTEDGMTVYSFVCADDQEIAAGDEFKFADEDWNVVNCGGGLETTIELEIPLTVYNGGNPGNLKLAETFTGKMYLGLNLVSNEGECVFSNDKDFECPWEVQGDGVATVAVENAPVVYYNLQGVRVANAENGLFIVKQGNKVSKVYVK